MPRHPLSTWVSHLRAIAGPVAVQAPTGAGPIEAPFRVAVCGAPTARPPQPVPGAEVGLWWALADPDLAVGDLPGPLTGPLWPDERRRGLEVWTEAELAGLHALWCLARQRGRADLARRAEGVRDWHLENTQPDNATNRPWALHVFLLADGPNDEAYAYAETLLHNALATRGRPDLFSAWILLDSARRIEQTLTPAP